ncbi:hypothetical protein I302_108078 [Kwoniella bestiolae CBS 10118]|uniref:Uncharacterized protein n=1 Tax=Kwoniella bestiolae CBS 10118 TaxID=1296100 RepID=A0A1B9FWQ3_9TREE|nr:hypothetical protein I302_07556 [Kwoniella bestiolae CBS 10118]OCF23202.1 hypothetical protein I302_07556 [Kwoniella bestiolae CBS 10118]
MNDSDSNLPFSDPEGWDLVPRRSGSCTPDIVSWDEISDQDGGAPIPKQGPAMGKEDELNSQSSGSDACASLRDQSVLQGGNLKLRGGTSENDDMASNPELHEALKVVSDLPEDEPSPCMTDQRFTVEKQTPGGAERHERQQLGLIDDFSGIWNIRKRPNSDPSRFRASDVVPPKGPGPISCGQEIALMNLSLEVGDQEFAVMPPGHDGYHRIMPSRPFPADSRYAEIWCDPTMAGAILSSRAQPSSAEEGFEAAGSIRAVKRRVGKEFAEDLYVKYDRITRDVEDGEEIFTFKALSVEPTHGSDDPSSIMRVQFFKDHIQGRTCHLQSDGDLWHNCKLRVDDGTEGGMQFKTDHDFGMGIACGVNMIHRNSIQGRVWPMEQR